MSVNAEPARNIKMVAQATVLWEATLSGTVTLSPSQTYIVIHATSETPEQDEKRNDAAVAP